MVTDLSVPALQRDPWNKGRLIGQKRPLKPNDVGPSESAYKWRSASALLRSSIRRSKSKLRGCDLVRLRINDVFVGGSVRDRATITQKKTRPVQFQMTEQTRAAVGEGPATLDARKRG
jgi:hypothetical protein